MLPSQKTYALIKQFEVFRPTAYRPTKNDVWTIGWGHTNGVREGDTCTTSQAQDYLEDDVAWSCNAVNELVTAPLSQNQFDALVSFVFNIGRLNFENSTLLRKINSSDYAGAATQFLRWDHQNGRVLEGLLRRRLEEKKLFETV